MSDDEIPTTFEKFRTWKPTRGNFPEFSEDCVHGAFEAGLAGGRELSAQRLEQPYAPENVDDKSCQHCHPACMPCWAKKIRKIPLEPQPQQKPAGQCICPPGSFIGCRWCA